MSRRKQSNPKPLKRKAEDEELEELAEQLCLPRNVLSLGEPASESEENGSSVPDITVQTARKLKEGEHFGPYEARKLAKDSEETGDHIQTKDAAGHNVRILLTDPRCRWLKLIKSSSNSTSANFSIYTHGDSIWCRVKRDLELECELRTTFEGEKKFVASSSPSLSSETINKEGFGGEVGKSKIRRTSSRVGSSLVNGEAISPKREAPEDGEDRGRSPRATAGAFRSQMPFSDKLLVNGDVAEDVTRKVKRETLSPGPANSSSSPGSPPPPLPQTSSASLPPTIVAPEFIKTTGISDDSFPDVAVAGGGLPAFPPYGFQPAVPPGNFVYVPFLSGQQMSPRPSSVSSVSSDQNEPKTKAGFNCIPCSITFSSLRTLQAHQSFYCAHRTINLKNKNEDGSNNDSDNPHGRPKSRNHYTPRTRRVATVVHPEMDDRNVQNSQRQQSGEDLTISDVSNASENKSMRAGKTYACNFCDYVTDRKGGLTRHIRTHGVEANAQALNAPMSPDRSSPTSAKDSASHRYCSNCEIQFSSQKTYQVHKVYYCNTRHVHKTTTPIPPISPTIAGTSQQPNIYEGVGPHQNTVANRLRAEKNQSVSHMIPRPPSPNSTPMPGAAGIDPKTGLVFGHPFYAAISTSPLILVPCSYLPGRGITPSAGSIVLPNGSASDDVLSLSPVPAFAVVPNQPPITNAATNRTDTLGIATPKVRPLTPKSETDVKLGESSTSVDKPLDLSVRKKGDEDEQGGEEASRDKVDTRERINHSPSQMDITQAASKVAVVLANTALGMPTVATALRAEPRPVIPNLVEQTNPSVLVKQGTSRCKECNIVFYKHDNYLVHKRMYCASRQNRNKRSSTSSPENGSASPSPTSTKNGTASTKEHSRAMKRRESSSATSPARSVESNSPGHSPKSVKCPSPGTAVSPQIPTNSAGVISQQAIYQFYCLACGIKFTSLDNLRAHQTYYCPKRALLGPQAGPIIPIPSPGSHRGPETGHRCGKCKNYFPTDETLRCHPCGSHSQRKCPYCDVYCPTLSAAQRHLVTHTGVKAFRCTICGYKGHTLRGMRTHIRIHLDSGSNTPEENYIVCVGEDGSALGKTRKRSNTGSPPEMESDSKSPGSTTPNPDDPPNLPDGVSTTGASAPDAQHWCQYCGYTSSYKGNVVRHIKLVHREMMGLPNLPGGTSGVIASPSGLMLNKLSPNIPPAPTLTDTVAGPVTAVKKETSSPVASNGTDSEHSNDSRGVHTDEKMDMDNGSSCHSSPGTTRSEGRESPRVVKKEEGSSSSSVTRTSPSPQMPESPRETGCTGMGTKKNGSKYCKMCDISFKHLSNFIAHKKFYCNPQMNDSVVTQETTTV